ncbi:hypothetical protein [Hymenobacter qilianensis]|uniref:hypothetical protein n=1 Tax=Hymenobacter qilianensis TaxID=1385715 RepID=UPI001CB8D03B|nr:hypothetical protein [Hymenobacter qilianensis]
MAGRRRGREAISPASRRGSLPRGGQPAGLPVMGILSAGPVRGNRVSMTTLGSASGAHCAYLLLLGSPPLAPNAMAASIRRSTKRHHRDIVVIGASAGA